MSKESICSLSFSQLQDALRELGEKPFRAQQIYEWIYRKKADSFDAMTNLSIELRGKLSQKFAFPSIQLIETKEAEETKKFLWKLSDGRQIESVLISSFERRTVCLSSQVGCPARCAFCASGKEGLFRSLSVGEIVEQALHIDRMLMQKGERVSHLVYMGMGEPLENFDALLQSIRILNDEQGLNISQRRITVSTVGVAENIRRLAESDLRVNLALSLHAPNQEIRKKIIPYARKYPLEEILLAIDDYAEKTKRDMTFEYTLIAGLNDAEFHAHELAKLLQGRQCTVNLIPYNPIERIQFERPSHARITRFRDVLEKQGINTTWRYTKGDDIAAACGQLAVQNKPFLDELKGQGVG